MCRLAPDAPGSLSPALHVLFSEGPVQHPPKERSLLEMRDLSLNIPEQTTA
jgi:hypothetical protein